MLSAIKYGAWCDQIRALSQLSARVAWRVLGVRAMVYDFRDLVCWQLAYELKCEVFAFTATGPSARDFKYRDQIRAASSSAPANIAEGFGRFRSRDSARFYEIARASLMETRNHLIDGRDRGHLDDNLHFRLSNLTRAAIKSTTNLMRSKQRQANDSV